MLRIKPWEIDYLTADQFDRYVAIIDQMKEG
jgi:hypothetical protein